MNFIFSKDYKGPGFGFLTTARMYDKWGHFAGSATGVLGILGILRLVRVFETFDIWASALICFTLGLLYEIYQGLEAARRYTGKLPVTADGFSILDLICNIAGITLTVLMLG
jgi:hypothetical protein